MTGIFQKRPHLRGLLFVVAAIAMIAASWWLSQWRYEQKRQQRFDANLAKIISLISIPVGSEPAASFDLVRRFIHGPSRDVMDEEFDKLRRNRNLSAEGMIAHAAGKRSEPVHLECSRRAALMSSVLRSLGYKTRVIYVFDTDANSSGELKSHTFIDIFNPSTRNWESQDPHYNIFWKSVASGDRVSVFEAPEDLSKIEPCDGKRCGWDLVSDEGKASAKIRGLIDIVSAVDKSANQRISRFTSRADRSRVFTFTIEGEHSARLWPSYA